MVNFAFLDILAEADGRSDSAPFEVVPFVTISPHPAASNRASGMRSSAVLHSAPMESVKAAGGP
jgi:hypothetical protein